MVNIFRSPLRRRVNIEILKLRMQLSEIEKQKRTATEDEIIDLVIRQKNIEHDIELYRKLLNENRKDE